MHVKRLLGTACLIGFTLAVSACQSIDGRTQPPAAQPPQLISQIVFSPIGGTDWQVVYQTSWMDLASIRCVDHTTCYVLAEDNAILGTGDGGKSWARFAAPDMVVHSDSLLGCAADGFCLLIESVNGGSAWVTQDGGITWDRSGESPTINPASLACPAPDRCILAGRQGEVFSTDDAGKNWRSELASNGITYRMVACLNERVCYVAGMLFTGEFGVVIKTDDGGHTWTQAGDSPVHGLRAINCPTLSDCLSVGRFGVQVTQDGGRTWEELTGGIGGARSVGCLSPEECFVVDSNGQLLKRADGEISRQSIANEFALRDVSCISGVGCYAVGTFTAPVAADFTKNLSVSIGLVFLAGVVSFLSPCVLPVLPGYLTYLAARSSQQDIRQVNRRQILFHGIAFVMGFSIVFIILGATASAIGQLLYGYKEWITRIGGVLIVFFGLQMSGWLQIPFLEMEFRKHAEPKPRTGYLSSLLMGVFFSAGWTPCVGPTLGVVLTFAGTEASMLKGVLLLALYSLGLGLPFILTALAMDRVGQWMRRMANVTRYVTLGMGILLAGVGMLLILDQLNFLGELFPRLAIYL